MCEHPNVLTCTLATPGTALAPAGSEDPRISGTSSPSSSSSSSLWAPRPSESFARDLCPTPSVLAPPPPTAARDADRLARSVTTGGRSRVTRTPSAVSAPPRSSRSSISSSTTGAIDVDAAVIAWLPHTAAAARSTGWVGENQTPPTSRALGFRRAESREKKSTVEQFSFSKRVSKRFSLTRFRSLPSKVPPFGPFRIFPSHGRKYMKIPLQMFIQMFIRYFRVGGKTTSSGICQFSVTATLERMCAAGCQMAVRYMPAGTPSISTVDSFVDIFFELFQTSNRNSN